MPAFDEYEDELVTASIGGLTGLNRFDPTDRLEGTLDPWAEGKWFGGQLRRQDAGDDELEGAVRSVLGDSAFEGDTVADTRARQGGADPAGDTNLLQLARSQLGVEYVWAASDPGEGFDCSGFTQWVLKRYGINTVHKASEQQQQFAQVGRDDLQAGDLVFFNYGRLGPGVADHVGLYIGGGMMIDASSSNDAIVERPVDWDHFLHGGATGVDANSAVAGVAGSTPGKKVKPKPAPADPQDVAARAAGALAAGEKNPLALAVYGLEGPTGEVPATTMSFGRGKSAKTKAELYRGFIDAGRPDLAAMVGTKEFDAWIAAESGWQTDVTSRANNHGLANDGLFQVWRGHDFNSAGQVAAMSPYEQAKLVAQHFNLTPDDIQRYAQQIAAGEYHGWG